MSKFDNPYARFQMTDKNAIFFVILENSEKLATRSGFKTYKDALRYLNSVSSSWKPFIVKRVNTDP